MGVGFILCLLVPKNLLLQSPEMGSPLCIGVDTTSACGTCHTDRGVGGWGVGRKSIFRFILMSVKWMRTKQLLLNSRGVMLFLSSHG